MTSCTSSSVRDWGLCFAWGRRLRHGCVAVPESGRWGADLLWLFLACSGPLHYTCRVRGGVWMGELERWLRGLVSSVAPRAPLGVHLPVGASGPPPPRAPRLWGGQRVPSSGGMGAAFCGCERRVMSGAVPLPSTHLWTVWVVRGPRTGPTACALASWRCVPWGGRGGGPLGGVVCRCGGCPRSGLRPPPGCLATGPAVRVHLPLAVGADVRAWGPSTVPLAASRPCGGLRAAGVVGGRPLGGALPALRGASCVRCCPSHGCPPYPNAHVSRERVVWVWGPRSARSCEPAFALWGWREGIPGGGAFCRSEGRLRSGACPPPAARPQGGLSGSATHVLWARLCGRTSPALSLWLACPAGGCVLRVWWEAVPGRGGLPLL